MIIFLKNKKTSTVPLNMISADSFRGNEPRICQVQKLLFPVTRLLMRMTMAAKITGHFYACQASGSSVRAALQLPQNGSHSPHGCSMPYKYSRLCLMLNTLNPLSAGDFRDSASKLISMYL